MNTSAQKSAAGTTGSATHGPAMKAPTPPKARRMFAAVAGVALLAAGLSACGDKTDSLAGDLCDLSKRVVNGDSGLIATASEANDIRKEAKDADVSLGDVISAAKSKCPEVADEALSKIGLN